MGVFYESIPQSLIPWIHAQKIIWIASAPLSSTGHVNVSPKGGTYFGVTSPTQFWYIDLTGSGVETLSHLHEPENGRITVLLNSFDGPPRIVRLWGKGTVLEIGSEGFEKFVEEHGIRERCIAGTRAVVRVDIHQVGTSCGFSVPKYEFLEMRETLNEYFVKRVKAQEDGRWEDGIEKYWAHKNSESMDGLPGLKKGVSIKNEKNVQPIKKMVGPFAPSAMQKSPSKKISTPSSVVVGVSSFVLGLLVAVVLMEFWRGDLQGDFVSYTEEIRALFKERA